MRSSEHGAKGSAIPGCLRRLSNFERYLLWSVENSIAVVARIFGGISEEDLRRAINLVRGMHPLMGAKVVIDGDHRAWFSTEDVPETIFRVVPRTSPDRWSEEVRQEYLRPFEPERGPLMRFVLVYSPEVSELIAFAQHSICDGISLANLIRDILVYYTDPTREVQVLGPAITTDYLPEKSHLPQPMPEESAAIDRYNRQWRKSPHYFSQEDYLAIHAACSERTRHDLVLLQLEPEETARLAALCREKGVTVGSALTAAFMAAYQDVKGPFPENRRSIQVPFDLRRRLGGNLGDFLGFFVGAFKVPFVYQRDKTVWQNAEKLHGVIEKRVMALDSSAIDMESLDPTLVEAFTDYAPFVDLFPQAFIMTENLSAFAGDRENVAYEVCRNAVNKLPGTIATNLGCLNYPETYRNFRLDRMFVVASASDAFPLFLSGVSVNGRLAFSLNYVYQEGSDGSSPAEDWVRIRNKALEHLGFPERANDEKMG